MKKILKFVVLTCFSLFINFTEVSAQLAINSNHGNLMECDTLSRDIFIVWWDDDVQDFSNEASLLLDEMIALKDTFLNTYNMQDPIAPGLGFFINVYIHSPGNSNDFFSGNGWGNGVGNDALGGPHWTAPAGILSDSKNTAHETAHIFQWTSNSPGWQFDDSNWFVEASAEWFALTQYPNSPTSHITAKCLTRMPHVPLWIGWTNYPNSYPQNWQRENHQYA